MNLADAIRQAAQTPGAESPAQAAITPNAQETATNEKLTPTYEEKLDAATTEAIRVPEPPTPVALGNAVRLELFLSPEQLSNLFRAVVATQHSMMTLRETAAYLRVSPSSLEQMAQEGQVPAVTIDGRWRFPKAAIDEWLSCQAFKRESDKEAA